MTTALEKRCSPETLRADLARDLKRVKALSLQMLPCFEALGCALSIEESGCHGSHFLVMTSPATGCHLLWVGRDSSELVAHGIGFLGQQPGGEFWRTP